ncbi:MAG: LPS assembly lipoprotein LptE, partial [Acidobacteriota bacterium]
MKSIAGKAACAVSQPDSVILGEAPGRRMEKGCPRQPNLLAYSLVFLFVLTVSSACGYRVASQNRVRPSIKSLVVLPLENQTTAFEVEQILTQALIRAFVERSSYRVVNDPSKADAVLKGVISRMSANPVLFGGDTFGSTFLVTLTASV